MMIIQFNSLGVITSVDTSNASFRQGSKGEVIQAVFAGKSNSNHVAKINFTRPDGTAVQNLIMSPDPSDQSAFLFELDDLWFLAISGNATMTIFLYNASNVIQAQGQVTIPIESTDYDGEPTITQTQYDSLLTALAGKLGMPSSSLRVDELPEEGTIGVFYVVHDDENDDTRFNIYVWNSTTREYIWVGSNELDLNKYYTQEQGDQFEQDVRETVGNGSPKGVYATLSDLESAYPTGTTGIYVVSADGHWYYWNGSAWTDGGDYLSTANAISAKNFLNQYYITPLTDLDNAPDNSLFVISDNNACNIANKPQYFRVDDHLSTCLFYSYLTSYSGGTKVKTQVYKSLVDDVVFYRNKFGTGAWGSWTQDGVKYKNYFVNSGNYTSVLTDLNNAKINSTYVISLNGTTISNLPGSLSSSENVVLETITSYYISTVQVLYQYLYSRISPDVMYTRIKIGDNAWGAWTNLSKTNIFINYYSYADDLPDLNNAKKNIMYYLNGLESYYSNVSNLPSGVNTGDAILQTYSTMYQNNTECLVQTLVSKSSGKTFGRNKIGTGAWGSWTQWGISPNGRNKIVIGSSASADYSSLVSGFQAAANQGNCDVYIEDGTYDVSSQIGSIGTGLVLGKNNKYFFSSNSKVVCNYTGDDETILTENSIFKSNMNDGDFELHNLTAEASRIRYIVHDENGSEQAQHISRHIYYGCKFTFDNTNNPYKDTYFHCIGGGLGSATEIVIDSCIFNSVYVPNGKADAQYHGNWASTTAAQNGKANLIVKNSYFAHTFSISSPNIETQKKQLIFSGNSVAYDLYYNATSDAYWDVYKWNNEIRGS